MYTLHITDQGDPDVGLFPRYWTIEDLEIDHLSDGEVEEMITDFKNAFQWLVTCKLTHELVKEDE